MIDKIIDNMIKLLTIVNLLIAVVKQIKDFYDK